MPDVVTTVKRRSYGSRLGNSITGVIIGLVLFFGSFVALWMNEGNYVSVHQGLQEGRDAVVELSTPEVLPENEGKLVHVTGEATTNQVLEDETFGVTSKSLLLKRNVEVFQWQEKEESTSQENFGGSETVQTTYTYNKAWSAEPIDSSGFHEQNGHQNPGEFAYSQEEYIASDAKIGGFTLTDSLIKKLDNTKPLAVKSFDTSRISGSNVFGNYIYIGKNPSSPAVGDTRVSFEVINPVNMSVIAQQKDDSFSAYETKTGSTIEIAETGTRTAEDLFTEQEQTNETVTWIYRLAGFIAMTIGLTLLFGPLSMIFAIIPFLRQVTGFLLGIAAVVIALPLSAITIALAWLFYRPIVAVIIIVVAIGLAVAIKFIFFNRRNRAAPIPPAAQQPLAQPAVGSIYNTPQPAIPVQPVPVQPSPLQPSIPTAVVPPTPLTPQPPTTPQPQSGNGNDQPPNNPQ